MEKPAAVMIFQDGGGYINRDIERGKVSADRGLVVLVTVMVTLLSAAMIVFALLTAKQP